MRQFYNEPVTFVVRVCQSSVSLFSGILESVEGEKGENWAGTVVVTGDEDFNFTIWSP